MLWGCAWLPVPLSGCFPTGTVDGCCGAHLTPLFVHLRSFHLPPLHTGRSLTLLDPTYASRFVPIIASVSEHQPPSWPSYITDLHFAALLAPAGIIAAFRKLDNGEPSRRDSSQMAAEGCSGAKTLTYDLQEIKDVFINSGPAQQLLPSHYANGRTMSRAHCLL